MKHGILKADKPEAGPNPGFDPTIVPAHCDGSKNRLRVGRRGNGALYCGNNRCRKFLARVKGGLAHYPPRDGVTVKPFINDMQAA